MAEITEQRLLKDQRVVEEIKRHLWLESEKAGGDIGFDTAAEDWLNKYAQAWLKYHMPEYMLKRVSQAKAKKTATRKRKRPSTAKRRSAKSYLK
jgi:hypothetical protein